MSTRRSYLRRYGRIGALIVVLLLTVLLILFATTDDPRIWPFRNTLLYHLAAWTNTQPQSGPDTTSLSGCVATATNERAAQVPVLVSEPDGTTHLTHTNRQGCYQFSALPTGTYAPVVGQPGQPAATGLRWGQPLRLNASTAYTHDLELPPVTLVAPPPLVDLHLGAPQRVAWDLPTPGSALRHDMHFTVASQPNEPSFFYLPTNQPPDAPPLPLLIAIYPGPAASWEGVSIPLAAAGYAVLAVGPAYTFDIEHNMHTLQQLLASARAGLLPGVDGGRVVVVGGSYSSLHVLRMLSQDVSFRAAVLLGPPTDLFALRRQLEAGTFAPPFGLDQAIIALGWPHTNPEPYWHYSGRFHVRPDMPPILLMHSRSDEIVPVSQSEVLAAAYDEAGVPYEAHFFEGMSHYLLATEPSEDLDRLYDITLDFLARATAPQEAVPAP